MELLKKRNKLLVHSKNANYINIIIRVITLNESPRNGIQKIILIPLFDLREGHL